MAANTRSTRRSSSPRTARRSSSARRRPQSPTPADTQAIGTEPTLVEQAKLRTQSLIKRIYAMIEDSSQQLIRLTGAAGSGSGQNGTVTDTPMPVGQVHELHQHLDEMEFVVGELEDRLTTLHRL